MGNSSSQPEELNDRVFVMLGKAGIGKSTFGNFLIGGDNESFKASAEKRSYSLTRRVQSEVTTLSPGTLAGMGVRDQNAKIRVKVIDQPGMDDAEIRLIHHCDNLVKCLENLDAKSFAAFLIVVNLNLNRLSDDRCLLLTQLSELLIQTSYSFFSHAIIVFTHADKVGDVNNRAELMEVVRRKIQVQGWEELGEILQAVNERCIFVNGTSRDENYRIQIMKELFELSKSTLTIRFHANNDFTSKYLQGKLGVRGGGIVQEEFYNLDFQFHPDLNIYWRDEYRGENLEGQIKNAIQTMISLGEGVSAMVVLVSLVDPFSTPMEELILNLPGCYIPEDDSAVEYIVKKWWKQTFIVFKVTSEEDANSFVQKNIEMNPRIKSLVGKVSNRWTWVAEDTIPRTCRDRMTDMCIALRKEVAGRDFIQNTVIKEIKNTMKEYENLEGKKSEVRVYTPEFHSLMAKGVLTIMESENSVFLKLGGIPFKQKISVRSIRLILKGTCLSAEQINRFKARYTNA